MYKFCLTLGVPAAGADEAALLIDKQVTAIGALPSQVLGQPIVLQFGFAIITGGMFFQHAGNGISAGENRLTLPPGNIRATDATQLPHY